MTKRFGFTLAECATHVGVSNGRRKFAFTLAEVLITLGIIGVVAAITMPTLIQNYRKSVFYNQFLKAASVIENSLISYCVEQDDTNCIYNEIVSLNLNSNEDFYNSKAALLFYNYIIPSQFGIYENVDLNKYKFKFKDNGNYNTVGKEAVLTKNGYIYTHYNSYPGEVIIVDVNGYTGPNVMGRDMFAFYITNDGRIIWSGSDAFNSTSYHWSNACASGGGECCAGRLLEKRKMDY